MAGGYLCEPEMQARKVTVRLKTPKATGKGDRNRIKELHLGERDTVLSDTLFSRLSISGFDKTISAHKECMFITNGSSERLRGVTIELTYRAMDGRMYDRKKRDITVDLPAGETRRVEVPAWDTQGGFYYYRSKAPKSGGIPFKVEARVISVKLFDRY